MLPESISEDSLKPSVCGACGEPFACGATLSGCWCAQVKLTEAMRAELRERYTDCLCRACLERFAALEELSEAGKILG